jgi:hypothetical protein
MLRLTDGLYYDIVSDSNARRSSGKAFEELCLQMIRHYLSPERSVEAERRTSYGTSADILVEDIAASTGLIIECKIRRLPQRVLTSPDPFKDCADAFDDIIKGIAQIWRTYNDFYSMTPMNMAGVVLQYDPWTIMGNAFVSELFNSAHEEADRLGIPACDRIPVALVGYFDLECLLRNYDYSNFFGAACDWGADFQGWELTSVLRNREEEKRPKPVFGYDELVTAAVPWWGRI